MVESKLDVIINFIKKGTGAKAASKELTTLEKSTKGATDGTKSFNLAQTAAKIGLAAVTISALKQIPQMANLGFKYKNAQIALAAYAGSAEKATAITDAITEASGFAIDKFAAVTNATRLLSLGLANNADEAAQFTKVAVTLGATMGKDVQGAFEEFSLLLANQSILRLDTYGISAGKVREEMARLAAEFPELDRNTRFVTATMTIAEDKMGKLDAAGFEATSSIDRLGAGFKNLKITMATFVADGVLPVTDGLTGLSAASSDANERLAEGADTFAEYEKAAKLANTSLGGDVIGRLALSTGRLTEEQFEAVKSAQALADANEGLIVVEEKVILTQGGINELLQEQTFLSKALALGIGGSLTKAMEKYDEGLAKVDEKQKDIKESVVGLIAELAENEQAILAAGIAYTSSLTPSQKYLNSMESLRIKQVELNEKLEDGGITLRKYNNETKKVTQAQRDLFETSGDSDQAFQDYIDTLVELDDAQVDLREQIDTLDAGYDKVSAGVNELAESLRMATAELIFQAAATDLSADVALLLARELGLVDEATFAVAQEAQRLRIQFDDGAISAKEFATQAGDLATDIGSIQSKNVDINVNTIQAERNIRTVQERLNAVKLLALTLTISELAGIRGAGPGFQDGADFTIPDRGLRGDRVPVSFMAEQGERIQVTPQGESGDKNVNIENVNLNSAIDLAFFLEGIRQ